MTIILNLNNPKRKRVPLPTRDWQKPEDVDLTAAPTSVEQIQAHKQILAWFEHHPPEMPAPVRCKPVAQVKDQQAEDVAALMKPAWTMRTTTREELFNEEFQHIMSTRDYWHNAFLIAMILSVLFVFASLWYTGWQTQTIRGLEAMVEQSKHAQVYYPNANDRSVGYYQDNREPGGTATDPAPNGGDTNGD